MAGDAVGGSGDPERGQPEIIRTANFVPDAANFILAQARVALAERGEFRIALSGGNTPRPIYTELGRLARDLPWERVLFTFGDERCVSPNDPKSNFRMVRESLFEPQSVPEKSILRMRGEIDPQLAAQEYEDALALLVTSDKKRDLIERILEDNANYPASRINPTNGHLTWFIGKSA